MSVSTQLTSESIQVWLVDYIAKLLKVEKEEIDTQKTFKEFGMDSMAALGLLGDLSDFLECEDLEASLLFKYTTIEKLSNHLGSIPES